MSSSFAATSPAATPISRAETRSLFADLAGLPALVLAVSGGPDSTALLLLAARWRASLKLGPKLVAVTVDHGLRRESAREARDVARLARRLKVSHRTLRWKGKKPETGLQAAARAERYRLLARAAVAVGARHVLTAHTRDDQAETVLIRLTRGSGLAGLGAMARVGRLPAANAEIELVRPLADIPKARLLATLKAARIPFADDPSNRNRAFTRVRMRELMPALEREGLSASRLATLARRLARANVALERATDAAFTDLLQYSEPAPPPPPLVFDARGFRGLPEEIALRLLGRAIAQLGDEGPVELGKLETLYSALSAASSLPFRRTLAGALVTIDADRLKIERAPPRRSKIGRPQALTKRKGAKRKVAANRLGRGTNVP
jgi:tRNA(Ile)-lysidine synthase